MRLASWRWHMAQQLHVRVTDCHDEVADLIHSESCRTQRHLAGQQHASYTIQRAATHSRPPSGHRVSAANCRPQDSAQHRASRHSNHGARLRCTSADAIRAETSARRAETKRWCRHFQTLPHGCAKLRAAAQRERQRQRRSGACARGMVAVARRKLPAHLYAVVPALMWAEASSVPVQMWRR
jgi:hypothetical protein